MIGKLRRRLTLLVWITLLVIMVGVVATVNLTNWTSLVNQAESALETLARQNGERPLMNQQDDPGAAPADSGSTPPPVDENGAAVHEDASMQSGNPPQDDPGSNRREAQNPDGQGQTEKNPMERDPGNPMQNAGQVSASLSNYYSVRLDHDGTIESWSSDRSDLYTDDTVSAFTAQALASDRSSGHIDSQFYLLQDEPYGRLLIVLNMQLEMINARTLLRNTVLIGLATWLLMSLGAFFLIRRLIRPVQEAFDRQRQFVWDASHEMKTPLAVISANADALSRDIGQSEWLDYIHEEISRATRMINSMLILAQIDQGAIRAQMKPFDLSRTVTGILLPFESVVFEAGKTLVSEVPEGITCNGDEAMIGQLVSILLSNAVKYANEGGTITVRLSVSERHRILTVQNTGEGISPRDQEHLFERFYRADASHNSSTEGCGLGLAIAKSLTDAHHGRISVDCPAQGGTRFTVILP